MSETNLLSKFMSATNETEDLPPPEWIGQIKQELILGLYEYNNKKLSLFNQWIIQAFLGGKDVIVQAIPGNFVVLRFVVLS